MFSAGKWNGFVFVVLHAVMLTTGLLPALAQSHRPRADAESRQLSDAEDRLADADAQGRTVALREIKRLAERGKDEATRFRALAIQARELRRESQAGKGGALAKAKAILAGHDDFARIRAPVTQPTASGKTRNPYVPPFLELAHCRALDAADGGVREALKRLDFARRNTFGLDECLALLKSGDICHDLGEFRDAETFLQQALARGNALAAERKAAASPGGEADPRDAEWWRMKADIERLLFLVSMARLEEDYGEGYALYVKARTLHGEGKFADALAVCGELAGKHPDTLYARAAALVAADCRLADGQVKAAKKELQPLLPPVPDHPLRGEALMRLGRIQLERDWDAPAAAASYRQALAWFRRTRETRDALDLYGLPDDVARAATPAAPPSSLDPWLRTQYRKPAPSELPTPQNTPWYLDENEKECLFMVGFFLLAEGRPDEAWNQFALVKDLNRDLAMLEAKKLPNVLARLKGGCTQGYLIAEPEVMASLRDRYRLRAMVGDFHYILERFDDSRTVFQAMLDDPRSSAAEKAYALVGIGNSLRMKSPAHAKESMTFYRRAYEEFPRLPAAAGAMLSYAYLAEYSGDQELNRKSTGLFLSCHQRYPGTRSGKAALYEVIIDYMDKEEYDTAIKYIEQHLAQYPECTRREWIISQKRLCEELRSKP